MRTEAQKKARARYVKTVVRHMLTLYPNTEQDIIAHLSKQENKSGYIKRLIREDISKD